MIDDDEAYGLHCDIGRLEQENATLRQQLEDVTASMGRVEERYAHLRDLMYSHAREHAIQHMTEDELRITLANELDENHKLRELVRDYDKTLELSIVGYNGPDAPLLDAVYVSLRSRMYELGMEVG